MRSIFAQSEQHWELIVVCDGAPDILVTRLLQITDKRVKVIVHHENRGLPFRLNEIANTAEAEYLARMDSDDVMHPERLATQLAYLESHPTVDVLGSASFLMTETNVLSGRYREPALPNRSAGYLQSGVFSHPTVIFKTAWAVSNPYESSWVRTEDKELWLRTSSHSTFEKIAAPLLYCRVPLDLSVPKQALTAKWDRRLIRRFGPPNSSRIHVATLIAKSHLKQRLFQFACVIGLSRRVHSRKASPLDNVSQRIAEADLDIALSTSVPGWD